MARDNEIAYRMNVQFCETPQEHLTEVWRELMDCANAVGKARAEGFVEAFFRLGLISEVEAEGWVARFDTCPEKDGHVGGRNWCAFCGDLPNRDDEEERVSNA